MRVLVTGSRTWPATASSIIVRDLGNYAELRSGLSEPLVLVHGACPTGADAIADAVAPGLGYTIEPHPADWERHGRKAGFLRNAEMVALGADVCLAYIRAESRGASMTVAAAAVMDIPTIIRRMS